MYLAHKVFQVNAQELRKAVDRKARHRARQILMKAKAKFKAGEYYSGREVKAEFNFMIENLK